MKTEFIPGVGAVITYNDVPVQKSAPARPKVEQHPKEYIGDQFGNMTVSADEVAKSIAEKSEAVHLPTWKKERSYDNTISNDSAKYVPTRQEGPSGPTTGNKKGAKYVPTREVVDSPSAAKESDDELKPIYNGEQQDEVEDNNNEEYEDVDVKDHESGRRRKMVTGEDNNNWEDEKRGDLAVSLQKSRRKAEKEEEEETSEEESEKKSIAVGDYVYVPEIRMRGIVQHLSTYTQKSQNGFSESIQVTVKGAGRLHNVDISEVMPA